MVKKRCLVCKKLFFVKLYRKKKAKYCSSKCYGKSKKGKPNPLCTREKHGQWKNGRRKNREYILILRPDHPFCDTKGYVPESRFVVEKQIGRYLLPTERVHHLGERNDNKPCMLMAFISISAHHRFHKDPLLVKPSEIIFDGRKLTCK